MILFVLLVLESDSNPEHVVKRLPTTKSQPSELRMSALARQDEGAFDEISDPVSRSVAGCPLSRGESQSPTL